MKIIHHNDADGRLSARIIYDHLVHDFNIEKDFIELDYSKGIPVDKIAANEVVWIVDYSFTETTKQNLIDLLKVTPNVYWIDHHASSVELEKTYPLFSYIRGIRRIKMNPEDEVKVAGCYLTYYYIKLLESVSETALTNDFLTTFRLENFVNKGLCKESEFTFLDSDVPTGIRYVSLYDTFSVNSPEWEDVKYASFYFNNVPQHPFAMVWSETVDDWVKKGKQIKEVLDLENKTFLEKYGWIGTVHLPEEDFKCLFINKRSNSYIFDSVGNKWNRFDALCVYGDDGRGFFTTTFYGPDGTITARKIATFFGGGGHDGAAGCTIPLENFYKHIEYVKKLEKA